MEPTSDPTYDWNTADGYKVLQAQYRVYRKGLEKMVEAGIMPGKMAKPGVIWGFARWLYMVSMLPLVVLVLYVVVLYTGIWDRVAYGWNSFLHDSPYGGKVAAVFLTLLAVGFLAFLMLGPLVKLGILPLFNQKELDLEEEEADIKRLFFSQPMRTRSAYNVLFVVVISVMLFLIGMLVSLMMPAIGTGMMVVILVAVLAWWFWQQATRPTFGFRQSGEVYARYPNSEWQLYLKDCKKITMAYADSMYFSRWYDRPFIRRTVKAAGATSFFPYKLIFELHNGQTHDLGIFNARFANKEHISAQEVEILVAEMLHNNGFGIQLQHQGEHISGWEAQPKQ